MQGPARAQRTNEPSSFARLCLGLGRTTAAMHTWSWFLESVHFSAAKAALEYSAAPSSPSAQGCSHSSRTAPSSLQAPSAPPSWRAMESLL